MGRNQSPITLLVKTDSLGEITWFIAQSDQSRKMRNKIKSLKYLPLIPLFFLYLILLFWAPFPSLQQCRKTGNENCGQIITSCFCCCSILVWRTPHTFSLLHCRILCTGVLHEILGPSYRRQFFISCPNMGPFHGVQFFRNKAKRFTFRRKWRRCGIEAKKETQWRKY